MKQKACFIWGQETLQKIGIVVLSDWAPVREMLWSSVFERSTNQGRILLKMMAPPFANESVLLGFLNDRLPEYTPQLVASCEPLSCFMMRDAGDTLRNVLFSSFSPSSQALALKVCAEIQMKMVPYVSTLVHLGVNDWQLDRVEELCSALQKKIERLKGLIDIRWVQILEKIKPKLNTLCQFLFSKNVPQTLEHMDFNDTNVLVKGEQFVISDWGDACITHPFFSCLSFLDSAKRHHPLTAEVEEELIQAYLNEWGGAGDLRSIYESARIVHPFFVALSHIRFFECEGTEAFPEFRDFTVKSLMKLETNLKDFS